MTFTRTVSGLKNSPKFFGCDLIVYVEGKKDCSNTFDEKYYFSLVKNLTSIMTPKIKVVGNKNDAMNYFEQIARADIDTSIVIIDKDLVGLSSSLIEHKNLFVTYGYSWENDFWTLELCQSVISNATINKTDLEKFKKSWNTTYRYAAKICMLDAVCQINGETIIPKKKKSCGIKLSMKNYNFIAKEEFKRLASSYKSKNFYCQISQSILDMAKKKTPCEIVQGHLCEYIAIEIIRTYYKKVTKEVSFPNALIKNLAFSEFVKDPLKYLSSDCKDHFKIQFSRIGL